MERGFNESDWKLFRKKVPGWQEAFMERLVGEYAALLTGEGKASDKFWALEERIKKDRRLTGVIIEMSRSKMEMNILKLLGEGAITQDDLSEFSEDLRERIAFICSFWD